RDADALVAPLARDAECRECADDPFLEARDVAAHVRRAALQVEHDVSDTLPWPVIRELAAAPAGENRKARLDQVGGTGAGPRRVEWRGRGGGHRPRGGGLGPPGARARPGPREPRGWPPGRPPAPLAPPRRRTTPAT